MTNFDGLIDPRLTGAFRQRFDRGWLERAMREYGQAMSLVVLHATALRKGCRFADFLFPPGKKWMVPRTCGSTTRRLGCGPLWGSGAGGAGVLLPFTGS